MTGKVTFIGAGPGPADLITLRGHRALLQAEVVLYDHLIDKELLEGLSARLVNVGKQSGWHLVPQDQINAMLVALARGGEHVVRLKGGDPTVFGRVGEEALSCAEHGIPYEWIPGVTSAVAAPAFAGIPVTHRGVADSFCVVTAHRRNDEVDFSIPAFHPRTTVLLLMGVGTLSDWLQILEERGYPEDLPIAFVQEGARNAQRVITTTVGGALEDAERHRLEAPAVAVIGHVVSLRDALQWVEGDQAEREFTPLRVVHAQGEAAPVHSLDSRSFPQSSAGTSITSARVVEEAQS